MVLSQKHSKAVRMLAAKTVMAAVAVDPWMRTGLPVAMVEPLVGIVTRPVARTVVELAVKAVASSWNQIGLAAIIEQATDYQVAFLRIDPIATIELAAEGS